MTLPRRLFIVLDLWLEEALCAFSFTVMASLVFLQVIMRYVFENPLSWTDEIAVYSMVWSVYMGASLAVRERAHVRVLNGILAFGKPVSTILVVLSDLIWVGINILMVWQGMIIVVSFWKHPYLSPALGIDQKWPYLIIPIGFTLMTLRLGQIYYRWISRNESLISKPSKSVNGRVG